MNAPVGTLNSGAQWDYITLELGPLDAAEHEQRRRIGVLRNSACWKAHHSPHEISRSLARIVAAKCNQWIFAPTDTETLTECVLFLRRMLVLADKIEELEPAE